MADGAAVTNSPVSARLEALKAAVGSLWRLIRPRGSLGWKRVVALPVVVAKFTTQISEESKQMKVLPLFDMSAHNYAWRVEIVPVLFSFLERRHLGD